MRITEKEAEKLWKDVKKKAPFLERSVKEHLSCWICGNRKKLYLMKMRDEEWNFNYIVCQKCLNIFGLIFARVFDMEKIDNTW